MAVVLATASLVGLGVINAGAGAPATAAVYDATAYPLKFVSANRVAVSPAANIGTNVNDIVKYKGVTTIDGVVIDAVVKVVSLDSGGTITKLDDGGAVTANPPTSPQSIGDLLLTDIGTTGAASSVVLEFSFYEGGTYTGVGSGIPVTLANARVSAYDIDAVGSVKQYVEMRGFQSYYTYTAGADGVTVSSQLDGMVRFVANTTAAAAATSGSYSWARVQVNYDRTSTLRVRLGALGSGGAFHALDFSAGGIWTTNGTTVVVPTQVNNPNNRPPTTADVSLLRATLNSQTVLASSDFPYADLDDNYFAAVKVIAAPSASNSSLEFFTGTSWVTVANGTVISTSDIELGKLRLSPIAASGSFTFQVYDGLAYSTTATLSFTSPPSGQTIAFPNPGTQTGGATFASGATASSGLVPTLTSLTPAVCTVSGLGITTAALPVGVTTATCVIVAAQDGDASYGRADSVTQQFSVSSLLAQTITFADPGDREFSVSPIVTGAAAVPSGLAVSLNSLTPTVCTISGGSIIPVAPGLCSVRASQAGNASYAPASPVTRAFNLLPSSQTITFAQPADQLVNGGPLTLAPTASSGLTTVLSSSTTGVCTVAGMNVAFVSVGECTLTANQAGNASYAAAAPVTRSFDIEQVSQTITFAQPADQLVNGGPFTVAPSASSGLTPVLSSSTTAVCTVTGLTIAFVGAGTCTITADQPGNSTYAAAAPVSRSFGIDTVSQTIAFAQPADQLLNGGPLVLAPIATSGLSPVLSSSTTAVCTAVGMSVSFLSAGECTITVDQPGDATYAAAAPVTRSFDIDLVPQTITFAPLADQLMNAGPLSVAPTASSGLTPILSSSTMGVCTVSGMAVSFVSAGVCTLTADQAGNATYAAAATVTRSFDVDQVTQSITFALPIDQLMDGGPLVLAPTADSGLTPVLSSSTTGVCTISGMSVTFVSAGLCTITANQPGDAVYSAAGPVSRSFDIDQVTQVIAFAQPADQLIDAGPLVLAPTADSGLTPVLSSSTTGVCTISGMSVTFLSAGLCTITADQPGDATYLAAAPVSWSFGIGLLSQLITFTQPMDVSFGDPALTLTASTDAASLSPALSSSTSAVCTVTGLSATFLSPGLCTITADQAGSSTYAAAAPVTRSFRVVEITTTALDDGRAGQLFSQQLTLAGEAGGGVWSTTSALPAGITLDPATGLLSGTPTADFSGLVTFTYTENGVAHVVTLQLDIAAGLATIAFTGTDAVGTLTVAALLLLLGGIGIAIAVLQRRRRHSQG